MDTTELFKECIRRYPVGTKVNSLGGSRNSSVNKGDEPYLANNDKNIRLNADCMVYDFISEKWAEITYHVKSVINNNYEIY